MGGTCSECHGPLPSGGGCLDLFHELLALEARSTEPVGRDAHFYAVATYQLQHPVVMRLTPESLVWLRHAVRAVLSGGATTEELRARVGRRVGGAARVRRRDGDLTPTPAVDRWSMTVTEVLAEGERGYREAVARWASATVDDLDRAVTPPGPSTPRSTSG